MPEQIFTVRRNDLTDGSVIWEVWQRGSEQRLASAGSLRHADHLANSLNLMLDAWTNTTPHNTVDA